MMARTATNTGKEATWEEQMGSEEKRESGIDLEKLK